MTSLKYDPCLIMDALVQELIRFIGIKDNMYYEETLLYVPNILLKCSLYKEKCEVCFLALPFISMFL